MTTPSFPNLIFLLVRKINHTVNLDKRITSELTLIKDKEIIDKSTYKSIKPVGSRTGILCGSCKIHKETRNGLPSFRPILSAIDTPTYKLAKFLLKFLTPLTTNEYTATDSFHFAEEICQQDYNLHIAILLHLTSQSMIFIICLW